MELMEEIDNHDTENNVVMREVLCVAMCKLVAKC